MTELENDVAQDAEVVEQQAESEQVEQEQAGEAAQPQPTEEDRIAEERKRTAEKAFEARKAKRKAEELEQRLKELESKNTVVDDVTIPPRPDSWDDDYEEKLRKREEAIERKAQASAHAAQRREADALAQRDRERKELERSQALQSQFLENSKKLGVSQEALDKAQNAIVDYGVSPQLATHLLEDSDGPLMTQYLAANPVDLYDIVNADPIKAGVMLAGIKQKAASLKPKTSNAPKPATRVEGMGAPVKQRGPKGATFE